MAALLRQLKAASKIIVIKSEMQRITEIDSLKMIYPHRSKGPTRAKQTQRYPHQHTCKLNPYQFVDHLVNTPFFYGFSKVQIRTLTENHHSQKIEATGNSNRPF